MTTRTILAGPAALTIPASTMPGTAGEPASAPQEVTGQLERLVIGADVGADGYTTVDQADELAHHLALRPGQRLLDLGTGRGRPGLYLTGTSGCRAVLVDLPGDGLRAAAARVARDDVAERCAVVAADATRLPFPTAAFDAVIHTDVLCCLRGKLAALRECGCVLRRPGQIAFSTILITLGLSQRDRRSAARCGPPAVATRSNYHRLLRAAGFTDIDEIDLTAAYLATARRWLRAQQRHPAAFAALRPSTPPARRRAAITAIKAGLLQRSLFSATR